MESLLLGQKKVGYDDKGRIIIPSMFDQVGCSMGIVFAKYPGDYYHLYMLEKISSLIDELSTKRDIAQSRGVYQEITAQLNILYDSIVDVSKLDKQRRVLLPYEIRELSPQREILLQGKGDCIALFPNDEIYQNYRSENLVKAKTYK